MALSNSLMGTPGIRRFVSLSFLLVLSLSCLVNLTQAKRSACWRYGHSCWGGHGKRSGFNGLKELDGRPEFSPTSIDSSSKVLGMFDKTTGNFLPLPILSLMMSSVGSGTSGISYNRGPTDSPLLPPVRFGPMISAMADWKKQNNAVRHHDILYPPGGISNNKAYISTDEKSNGVLTRFPSNELGRTAGIRGVRMGSGGDNGLSDLGSLANHEQFYSGQPRNTINEKGSSMQQGKRDREELDSASPSDESFMSASPEHPYFDTSIFVRNRKRSVESKSPSASAFYTESFPSIEENIVSNESIGNSADEESSPEFQRESSSLITHAKEPSQSQPQLSSHSPSLLSPSKLIHRRPQSQIKLDQII